jgi:hypothetical protein
MTRGRVIEQAHGILAGERVAYEVSADGRRFRVPVPAGSAAVEIDFDVWARDRTMIRLRAHVLEDVEVRDSNRVDILEHLNALNQTALFGRFYLDADRSTIVLEHELLGDDLDAVELINALYTLGLVADQTDDELQRSVGTGRRAIELPPESANASRWSWPTDVHGSDGVSD